MSGQLAEQDYRETLPFVSKDPMFTYSKSSLHAPMSSRTDLGRLDPAQFHEVNV